MLQQRWWIAALVVAAISPVECTKDGETGTAEPSARGAPAREDAAGGTDAAEPGAPRVEGEGLMPALAAMGIGPRRAQDESLPEEPGAPQEPPFERMQLAVDMEAVAATPLWPLLREMVRSERDPGSTCLIDLLGATQSMFIDLRMGGNGEPSDGVLSAHTTLPAEQVLECFRIQESETAELTELPIEGRTGYAMPDSDVPAALVEAGPGWWVLGTLPALAAVLTEGTVPEDDAAFAGLVGPLGPQAVRVAMWPGPGYAASGPHPRAGEEGACIADAWARARGLALGAGFRQAFDVALAARYGSDDAADDTLACFEDVWRMLAPLLRAGFAQAHDPRLQAVGGRPLEQALSSVIFESPGEFAVMRGSIPLPIILAILAAGQD
jgi:hypothetical protein